MKLLRKAQVGGLQGFVLSIVTVAVVLVVGLIVLQELAETQVTSDLNQTLCNVTTGGSKVGCGSAYNATTKIITKLATVPTSVSYTHLTLPTILLV